MRASAVIAAVAVASIFAACGSERVMPAGFAGSAACRSCHAEAYAAWERSLHALAAQPAEPGRVAAAFDGRTVEAASVTAAPTTTRSGLGFAMREGGTAPAELVLGAAAVEQFLVSGPRGRWQAFPLGFDPVRREWFDLAPEGAEPRDWIHWQAPGNTANSHCLECHVTGYEKRFDLARDAYATTWAELGVGCEACHGPGAAHVRTRSEASEADDDYGALRTRDEANEACAPCHALRVALADGYRPGAALADFYDFELLDGDAHHADGQVRAEAYEWVAFQTSRMAGAGVVCFDCHDSHRGTLRASGNALCVRCHEAALDAPEHTHHPVGSAGAECVACHMPEQVFMERDRRRDHAFARPDPERSALIGAPDPCTTCHADRSPEWAARRVDAWYGPADHGGQAQRALAVLIEAARRGEGDPAASLVGLLASDLDEVRRASVARLLASDRDVPVVAAALEVAVVEDASALVRASAARALGEGNLSAMARGALLGAVSNPRRLVRMEVAFALRTVDPTTLDAQPRAALDAAVAEWLAAQAVLEELPEPHFNVGLFHAARGDAEAAVAAYRRAIARWPFDLAPRQNLAMLLAAHGRGDEAETAVRAAMEIEPRWVDAECLLGQILARGDDVRDAEAVAALERCVERSPRGGDWRRIALRELVRVAHRADDRALAERWLPEALLADPATASDPEVRAALGGDGP